jgi:hypothetical protein
MNERIQDVIMPRSLDHDLEGSRRNRLLAAHWAGLTSRTGSSRTW